MPTQLPWKKYLTREYSFLFISYALKCYSSMKKFVIAHGTGNLVSLYGVIEDSQNVYSNINETVVANPQKVLDMMEHFKVLAKEIYSLSEIILKTTDKPALKNLLIELDTKYLQAMGEYIFFIYLGYGANRPGIAAFLDQHRSEFEKIRNATLDTDLDKKFPLLFGQYEPALASLASYMSRQELLQYLEGAPLDLVKIKARKKHYLIIVKNNVAQEYGDAKIEATLAKELPVVEHNTNQVVGQSACKGIVTGSVRIIFTEADYPKIESDIIIVTPMTKPSITPYLTKVKGIITNDGGALSHASIISREFGIPCLVGTTYATDIFKDDDRVELDANNGIARRVE